jgi:bifunctional DNA-binding transcriptional regulator/antitoxin component of YhaV-PrlF toxin-antitoxin module
MAASHVMKVSKNGQVSIPAETRARWRAEQVIVVDLGDYIVMRPLPADPIGELVGKYKGRGPGADEARRLAREEDAEDEGHFGRP